MGKTVTFCYAKPYGYTDLVKDLNRAKHKLLKDVDGEDNQRQIKLLNE